MTAFTSRDHHSPPAIVDPDDPRRGIVLHVGVTRLDHINTILIIEDDAGWIGQPGRSDLDVISGGHDDVGRIRPANTKPYGLSTPMSDHLVANYPGEFPASCEESGDGDETHQTAHSPSQIKNVH